MADHHLTYPEEYWLPITAVLQLAALMASTLMLRARWPSRDSRGKFNAIEPARMALLFVLLMSTLFIFLACVLGFGLDSRGSVAGCRAIFWICVTSYALTKVLITWFLIERVHLVHGGMTRRIESKLYRGNFLLMLLWVAFAVVIIFQDRGRLRPSDGVCMIVISRTSAILGGVVEVTIDVYLCLLFAVPLIRGSWYSSELRWIAIRSLIATSISMCSSTANMIVFVFIHGKEMGWMCLALCTLDTLINASVLVAVTSRPEGTGSTYDSRAPLQSRGTGAATWGSRLPPEDPSRWRGDVFSRTPGPFNDMAYTLPQWGADPKIRAGDESSEGGCSQRSRPDSEGEGRSKRVPVPSV